MANGKMGGWELADMQPCALPEKVATGFSKVVTPMLGADYTPVLYVGQQIVAGSNHMILCKQKPVVLEPQEHLVEVILHSAPTTGDWSLVSVTQIV